MFWPCRRDESSELCYSSTPDILFRRALKSRQQQLPPPLQALLELWLEVDRPDHIWVPPSLQALLEVDPDHIPFYILSLEAGLRAFLLL